MIVEKFDDFDKNKYDSIIDYIESLIKTFKRGYVYTHACSNVYCFSNNESSLLCFDEDSNISIQKQLENDLVKKLGGFNFYIIDKKLSNPFFNSNNNYLESYFYFRDKNFNKMKYFISKLLMFSEEEDYIPEMIWKENLIIVKLTSNNTITNKDKNIASKISSIYKIILES